MKKLPFHIEICSPVIFSVKTGDIVLTASKDYFAGNVVRGAFAKRMIGKNNLGQNAHEDADFRRLFLSGSLKFLPAYPKDEDTIVLPMSLQRSKMEKEQNENKDKKSTNKESKHDIKDLVQDKGEPGYKPMQGFGYIKNIDGKQQIGRILVRKNISLHMGREKENERISGKSTEGTIFNYESLEAGQTFTGSIIGDEADLALLVKVMQAIDFKAYFGRSKHTQYGQCKVSLGGITNLEKSEAIKNDTVFLRAHTAFLPYKSTTNTLEALAECVDYLNEKVGSQKFSLVEEKVFAKWEEVENFVGVWGMKRPRQYAISAGSVFGIKKDNENWTECDFALLDDLLYGKFANRSEEGFGQFRIWQEQRFEDLIPKKKTEALKQVEISNDVKKIAKKIVLKYVKEEMRNLAYAKVKAINLQQLNGKKHIFSRLEMYLKDCYTESNICRSFTELMKSEIHDKSQAEKHLRGIKLHGQDLMDILRSNPTALYGSKIKEWYTNLDKEDKELKGLAQEINFDLPKPDSNELFYEYWLWFFRHARKQADKEEKKDE